MTPRNCFCVIIVPRGTIMVYFNNHTCIKNSSGGGVKNTKHT